MTKASPRFPELDKNKTAVIQVGQFWYQATCIGLTTSGRCILNSCFFVKKANKDHENGQRINAGDLIVDFMVAKLTIDESVAVVNKLVAVLAFRNGLQRNIVQPVGEQSLISIARSRSVSFRPAPRYREKFVFGSHAVNKPDACRPLPPFLPSEAELVEALQLFKKQQLVDLVMNGRVAGIEQSWRVNRDWDNAAYELANGKTVQTGKDKHVKVWARLPAIPLIKVLAKDFTKSDVARMLTVTKSALISCSRARNIEFVRHSKGGRKPPMVGDPPGIG